MNSEKTPHSSTFTDELWGVFSGFFGEEISRDIESALYSYRIHIRTTGNIQLIVDYLELTFVSLVTHKYVSKIKACWQYMTSFVLVNISLDNDLSHDGTKPLIGLMLTFVREILNGTLDQWFGYEPTVTYRCLTNVFYQTFQATLCRRLTNAFSANIF